MVKSIWLTLGRKIAAQIWTIIVHTTGSRDPIRIKTLTHMTCSALFDIPYQQFINMFRLGLHIYIYKRQPHDIVHNCVFTYGQLQVLAPQQHSAFTCVNLLDIDRHCAILQPQHSQRLLDSSMQVLARHPAVLWLWQQATVRQMRAILVTIF